MSLTPKLIDGFEHYATAQLPRKYTTVTGSPTIGANGRNANALTVEISTASNVALTVDAQPCFLVMGAFKFTAFAAATIPFIHALDTATVHLELRITSVGVLAVARNGTELANSGAFALQAGTWYHIAIAGKIDDSGTYDVWVNGVKIITGSGDTRNGGNASVNSIKIGWAVNPGAMAFSVCDLAIYNGASYTDADFPGDCRVMTSLPTGAGHYAQWTGTYADVDDATPDDDTTALTDATAGNISTFPMTPIAGAGTVKAVQVNIMARKDDSGARTIASVARLGTTDAVGATVATGLTFVDYMTPLLTKPGGGAWTVEDVNACEFGVKTIA